MTSLSLPGTVQRGDARGAGLRGVEAEAAGVADVVAQVGFGSLHFGPEAFVAGGPEVEGPPGDVLTVHIVLPEADQAAAVDDRVVGEIGVRAKGLGGARKQQIPVRGVEQAGEVAAQQDEGIDAGQQGVGRLGGNGELGVGLGILGQGEYSPGQLDQIRVSTMDLASRAENAVNQRMCATDAPPVQPR